MAVIMDGRALAGHLKQELAGQVVQFKTEYGLVPGLVVILVGENPASQIYVANKERSALEVGFKSEVVRLPADISQDHLLDVIASYNQNPLFHGILVQLPLPQHIDAKAVLMAISPEKDVDGFHPLNMGRLWAGEPLMIPCTPEGIMTILRAYDIPLEGRKAVVVGASNIVGKPMAQLLLSAGATVTTAHIKTQHLAAETRQADILVIAIGDGHFITKEHVKDGAVVIDVGINRTASGHIIGDVNYDDVYPVASHITPVPGGVGPMTIATLLTQTYQAALRQVNESIKQQSSVM